MIIKQDTTIDINIYMIILLDRNEYQRDDPCIKKKVTLVSTTYYLHTETTLIYSKFTI